MFNNQNQTAFVQYILSSKYIQNTIYIYTHTHTSRSSMHIAVVLSLCFFLHTFLSAHSFEKGSTASLVSKFSGYCNFIYWSPIVSLRL